MLDIINVHKTFNPGTINEKVALAGVDLHLNPGDFCTIIGGNGASQIHHPQRRGGVWPVDEGSIIIDGENVTVAPRAQAGLLPGPGIPGPHDRHRRHHEH